MSNKVTIKVGAHEVSVSALPLGKIRAILGAIHRVNVAVAAGVLDEALIDDVITVLSAAIGVSKEEIEAAETSLVEVEAAIREVIKVSGLEEMINRSKGGRPGEVVPVVSPASTHSTNSTQP
jgi:hypothetical protein